jgi:hypothetical protein
VGGLDDDADLGDDPFSVQQDAGTGGPEIGKEAWVGTDRDYTYSEVSVECTSKSIRVEPECLFIS